MISAVGHPFSLALAAPVLGGTLHPETDRADTVRSITIDSRSVREGSLFVPLSGRFSDGHDFIAQAVKAGACLVLVNESRAESVFPTVPAKYHARLLIVDDSLMALHRLSSWYMQQYSRALRIAVTGSNGKTTTKECIAAVLGQEYAVFKTPGNFNSIIGLPIAAFGLKDSHEYAVFELAMSEVGEMAMLAELVFPDIAVVTNIGTAHIGNIGSQQKIAEEKKALFSCFSGAQKAFLREDDPFYRFLSEGVNGTVLAFGTHYTPGFTGAEDMGIDGSLIHWNGMDINFCLPGAHNLQNALAAVSVAVEIGLSPASIQAGLEAVELPFGRGQIIRGGITIIQDCYNANPESMEAALDFFASVNWPGRKIAVLGDMLELGDDADHQHERIAQIAASAGCDVVFFVGKTFERIAGKYGSVFSSAADAHDSIIASLQQGDVVLLKASRGLALETIGDAVREVPEFGGVAC